MHRRALTKLRMGFVLLGVALLLPLAFLVREAEARFEAQRRLRHEIVAERIFDEMERELTGLLEAERSRPSSAYATTQTDVASWSPIVVGYFRYDGSAVQLPGEAQLADARSTRVRAAVAQLAAQGALAPLLTPAEKDVDTVAQSEQWEGQGNQEGASVVDDEGSEKKFLELKRAQKFEKTQPIAEARKDGATQPKQEAVLHQLNRALTERSAQQKKKARPMRKSSMGSKAPQSMDDPLSGLSGL